MDQKWSIKIYESPNGEKPVEEFIKSTDEKAQLKISRMLDHPKEISIAQKRLNEYNLRKIGA